MEEELPLVDTLPALSGPLCCPLQTRESDIPVIGFDIKNDGHCHVRFSDVQQRRTDRLMSGAPFLYRGSPVTAGRNPANPLPHDEMMKKQDDMGKKQKAKAIGGYSYHIVCLQNTLAPQAQRGRKVNLMMDDNSQYCLGFQRGDVIAGVEVWSDWYRVSGEFGWPSFVPNFQILKIVGDHGITVDIGGSVTLEDIFGGLWGHPDHPLTDEALQRVFLKGDVVLCETLRLLSISNEVTERIRTNAIATPLGGRRYKRIRSCNSACKFVLFTAGENHGKISRSQLQRQMRYYGYNSFEDLVTEIRVFKWQDALLKHYNGPHRRWLARRYPGTQVKDRKFGPGLA